MEKIKIDNSLISSLKQLSILTKQFTISLNISINSVENLNDKLKNNKTGLFKSIDGFRELSNSILSVDGKIKNINLLFSKNGEGSYIIIENLKTLKNNFIDLGAGIWGAFKNSLSFIWSLITQKGKLKEVVGLMLTYIRRTALSGLTALRAGGRMAIAGLRSIGTFIASIISATAAQLGFNLAVSANPLGALILGIMAVVGAITLVITYWDEIKAAIARFVVWVFENSPFGFLINVVDNIFPGFKDALGGLFDWVVDTFTKIADFIKGIWNSIKSWFGFGDGEEATVTVKPDANGNYTGGATDAYGDPLELDAASKDAQMRATEQDISRSVTDYVTTPEAISRPHSATPETISQPSQAAGASQAKSVSVRIENLVKNLNLNVTNMQEGSAKIRDEVNRALIAAIRDTEIALG